MRFHLYKLRNYIRQLQFHLYELRSNISQLQFHLFELRNYIRQLKSYISLLQNYKSTKRNTKDLHYSYFDRQQSIIRLDWNALWQRRSFIYRQLFSKQKQLYHEKGLLIILRLPVVGTTQQGSVGWTVFPIMSIYSTSLKKMMISYGESDRFCWVVAREEKIKEIARMLKLVNFLKKLSRKR